MKRFLAIMLCAALLFGCAQGAVSIRIPQGSALLNPDGSEIVPLGIYEDIAPISDGLYAAYQNGKYALMNAGGEVLTPMQYELMHLENGMIIARKEGRWGLLDLSGAQISAFEYSRILPAGNGVFWALKGEWNDQESDEIFILDASGAERATGIIVRSIGSVGEDGIMAVLLPEEGLWGYCNVSGELEIPAVYESAGRFISGCAAVSLNGAFGAIGRDGNMIVPAQFDYLEVSEEGFILAAQTGQGVWVFDLQGKEMAAYSGEETFGYLCGNGYAVNDGENLVLYDAGSAERLRTHAGGMILDGLKEQVIVSDGAWGEECVYISGTDIRRQNLYPLGIDEEGNALYACMRVNTARYMNDLLGEIQLAVDMDTARYGVVDEKGEELVASEYESVEYIGENRLMVLVEGRWQMIDFTGRAYWTYGIMQIAESSF